jgi:hypothetical protein
LSRGAEVRLLTRDIGYAQMGRLNLPKLETVYQDGFEDFRRLVTAKYPRIDEANLSRLFSQGSWRCCDSW